MTFPPRVIKKLWSSMTFPPRFIKKLKKNKEESF